MSATRSAQPAVSVREAGSLSTVWSHAAANAPSSAWLLALYFLALLPRLVLIALNPASLEPWEYDTIAQNVVSGQGYVIPRFGHLAYGFGDGNLYTFLSSAVYVCVGHQPVVLAAIQAMLASLAAPVIFAIGAPAFGHRVAALGGALAALHPGLLAYTLKLHPLGLDVLLLALTILWIGLDRGARDNRKTSFIAGLALGMTLMSRPTFFLAGLAALAVSWLRMRQRLLSLILPIAVAVAIASPWVLRNWAVFGRPLFISTSMEDVWKGNNPMASGSSYLPNGQDIFSAAPPDLQVRLNQANELELNDLFTAEVVGFIGQHPLDFVGLTARKFAYFWWLSPQAGLFYPSSWLGAYAVYFATALGFAILGAVAILRRGTAAERALLATIASVAFTVAVIHALAYVEGRHRWGIEPLLLLLTARGIASLIRVPFRGRSTAMHSSANPCHTVRSRSRCPSQWRVPHGVCL